MALRLYTQCPNCGHVIVVEAETNSSTVFPCDRCGHRISTNDLREPFQRQIDEGPVLEKDHQAKRRDGGYNNA